MKFALFVAEQKTTDTPQAEQAWRNFLGMAEDIAKKESGYVSMLNESTFLCNLSSGLFPLSSLVSRAKEWSVVSRVLFFDQEPSWVVSGKSSLDTWEKLGK